MVKTKSQLQLEAMESLARYRAEIRTKRVVDLTAYIVISVVFVFLVMMFSGETFRGTLNYLGLEPWYNPKGGVFADCNDPANRHNDICQRPIREKDRQWKRVEKGSLPFTLTGK